MVGKSSGVSLLRIGGFGGLPDRELGGGDRRLSLGSFNSRADWGKLPRLACPSRIAVCASAHGFHLHYSAGDEKSLAIAGTDDLTGCQDEFRDSF